MLCFILLQIKKYKYLFHFSFVLTCIHSLWFGILIICLSFAHSLNLVMPFNIWFQCQLLKFCITKKNFSGICIKFGHSIKCGIINFSNFILWDACYNIFKDLYGLLPKYWTFNYCVPTLLIIYGKFINDDS